MSLITPTNLLVMADHLAAAYDLLLPFGDQAGSPVVGTVRDFLNKNFLAALNTGDYEQETDLNQQFFTAQSAASQQSAGRSFMLAMVSALEGHISSRGKSIATSINSFSGFLSYYNGGLGGAAFSNMVAPSFAALYLATRGSNLPPAGVLSPAIHPLNGAANGMGIRAVGGAFTDGAAVDTTKYSGVTLNAVVTVNFASGTAPPTLTVAGVDNTGVATTTWTGTLVGNNPAAAVATTITPVTNAWARQTVALASITGIVPGQWLTVDSGLPTQENILVETVAGSNITAVFKIAHLAGAAITGNTTLQLTPSVGGRRCVDVTNITIGITGHSAGTVMVRGVQDRVAL